MMKKKMIGILVCMLLIATVVTGTAAMDESINGERNLEDSKAQTDVPTTMEGDPYEYYTYEGMTNFLHELQDNHSDIMLLTSYGKTYEDREIWVVKLSDNVDEDEEEPEVLIMGAHHGNEKISYEILIYFIRHMVENYSKPNTDNDGDGLVNEDPIDGKDNDQDGLFDEDPSEDRVREVMNNTETFVIPMVNPDGVEANTRKNCDPDHGAFGFWPLITAYGVDLNRNYGYKWLRWFIEPKKYWNYTKQFNTTSKYYRGEFPFSQKETRAVKKLADQHSFTISMSYHSYGCYILYPWGYTDEAPPDEEVFRSISANISKINYYQIVQSGVWYFTSGSSEDWLYGRKDVIALAIVLIYIFVKEQ